MKETKNISTKGKWIQNRRDFVKTSGLAAASFTLATSCTNSVLQNSLSIDSDSHSKNPGNEKWFASSCGACTSNCPILVKTIDNRPIKIEGNPESKKTNGGLCGFGQASIHTLYSEKRLQNPTIKGQTTSWINIDKEIKKKLNTGKFILLSHTINSPSTLKIIRQFKSAYSKCQHIEYDTISHSAQIEANQKSFGKKVLPAWNFSKAKLIVGFNSDFLGTGINSIQNAASFVKNRDPENFRNDLKLIQFESSLTLTGKKADKRFALKIQEEGLTIIQLYNDIAKLLKLDSLPEPSTISYRKEIKEIAELLVNKKGRSLVISGTQSTDIQMIVNGINTMLENYGRTIDLDNPIYQSKGENQKIRRLVKEIENNKINGIIFYDCDPISDRTEFISLKDKIASLEFSVALNTFENKTSKLSKYVCPTNHFLESWNDHEVSWNQFHFSQPAVEKLYNTRQPQDSLIAWTENSYSYYTYLKLHWIDKTEAIDQAQPDNFDKLIQKGIYSEDKNPKGKYNFELFVRPDAKRIVNKYNLDSFQYLIVEEKASYQNGEQWLNPVLSELPDPISKVSWIPYLMISRTTANDYSLQNGDIIQLETEQSKFEFPVCIVPGVADYHFALPLFDFSYLDSKYTNAFELLDTNQPIAPNVISIKSFKKTSKNIKLPISQDLSNNPKHQLDLEIDNKEYDKLVRKTNKSKSSTSKFKENRSFDTHHWAMVIDLNKCIGCSSCMLSCQVENNIPNAGAKENAKRRNMHWMRIEHHEDGFLPVMCQHCDEAPCEVVCPVAATSSSKEGLNQQNYQKCIGTRFCASNCPYEVRKFNYADYQLDQNINPIFNTDIGKYALNPKVQTREKGIIEKCTMCVHRIQDAKQNAKINNRSIKDGDIKTACQQSCPTHAIYFGDLNDKSSKVYQLSQSKRAFRLLDELNTESSVYYLKKVRNIVVSDK